MEAAPCPYSGCTPVPEEGSPGQTLLDSAASAPQSTRRILRFVLGPLARLQQQQQQQQQQRAQVSRRRAERDDRLGELRRPPTDGDAVVLLGASDDDDGATDSDDVLGCSPFAYCADLQAYRRQAAEHRAARAAWRETAGSAGRAPQQPGPLRRVLRWFACAVGRMGRHMRPQGPGTNDGSVAERVFNVLTSIPFVLVGAHSLRCSSSASRHHFGRSFVATGIIAAAYHATTGGVRRFLRKADYWSICQLTGALRAAAGVRAPAALNAAAVALTPLRPTLVTGANLAAAEARFLLAALRHKHLRPTFSRHLGVASVGVSCFYLEDVLAGMGVPPIVHSLWHLLSAASLGIIEPLLTHAEAVAAAAVAAGMRPHWWEQ